MGATGGQATCKAIGVFAVHIFPDTTGARRRSFPLPYYIVPSGGQKRVFGETLKGAFWDL